MSESRPVRSPIPLSIIMAAAEANSKKQFPDHPWCWPLDRHFLLHGYGGITTSYEWGEAGKHGEQIPPEVLRQLVGQKAQAGLIVEYAGVRYLVWSWLPKDDKTPDRKGEDDYPTIGAPLTEANVANIAWLTVVRAELVDLTK